LIAGDPAILSISEDTVVSILVLVDEKTFLILALEFLQLFS
jgi:hypothetical protein